MITLAPLSLNKHQNTIRRYHDLGRRRKSVQPPALRKNAAAITRDLRIDPMVVDIAIESLFPEAAGGKSKPITCPYRFKDAIAIDKPKVLSNGWYNCPSEATRIARTTAVNSKP